MAGAALGQTTPDLTAQKAEARALEKRLPVPTLAPKVSFDLSPARQERFQTFLPKTYRKLSQREPLQVLVLGDASALKIHEGKPVETFPGVFAEALAAQFYYTGGVKVGPARGAAEAPTIGLRVLARPGGSVLDAASILQSTARQAPVDVVMICYGQGDAGMQPPAFARAVNAALAGAKQLGAEVILCSPWLPVAAQSESVLGLTRPLADALKEAAQELGVLYADLGDLSRLLTIPAPETQDEAQVFERVESAYREFFRLEEDGGFTPKVGLHQALGRLIYKDLLDAPPSLPWQTTGAKVRPEGGDGLTLTYSLKNSGTKAMEITALPLIASGWKPVEAKAKVKVEPGAAPVMTVRYVAENGVPPLQEAVLRLPLLICSGTYTHVETLRASVEPVGIVWGLETQFNQETGFLASCQVVNPGKTLIKGDWQAEFAGQKLTGTLDLPSEGTQPLNLRFDLPKESPAVNRVPLKLTLNVAGQTLTATRQVTLTRNLGLDQAIPLTATPGTKSPAPVTLTAKANAKALTLTFDLPGDGALQDAPDGSGPSWQVEMNLDARSYGKRLEQGSTATVRATGMAVDGAGKVHPVAEWAFGTGYAANFAPKEFQAGLSTGSEGRQITLTVPRSYLYLHEWALDNGNSQMGLGVRLTLQGTEGYVTYHLPLTAKAVNDVEALVVLELTAKPTARATVDVE
ncbi:hypothetical protein GCM10023213_34280 [Prosthecobacter algae]|uniref:Uncharacterized protein n=1 Tax=Prosthecobacter algae TaxID=1144682 RepID=A0ABP9PCB9_9BACT